MRCTRCGNENPDQNRFCGMCGASLLSSPAPAASQPQPVAAKASPQAPSSPVTATRVTEASASAAAARAHEAPTISGPSFLGLNAPAPAKRAALSIDPHDAPASGNLNYLLEDEEKPRHSGAGKVFLILIALALAVGLGYLRWKNHGFDWITPATNKPSATAQNSGAPDGNLSPSSAASPEAQPPAAQPAAPTQTPANSTAPATTASGTGAANSAATSPNTTPAITSTATADTSKSPDTTASAPSPDNTAAPPAKPAADTASLPPATSDQPKPAPTQPTLKPRAGRSSAPSDPVAEAQKYLYGRGAPQDCDRGMRLLKPAANQANPKAMIEMGALYSAGLCTPHDLPTAYRWFALALRKDPDNQSVQTDLQKLWGEMTQPERRLAIQLTQ